MLAGSRAIIDIPTCCEGRSFHFSSM